MILFTGNTNIDGADDDTLIQIVGSQSDGEQNFEESDIDQAE